MAKRNKKNGPVNITSDIVYLMSQNGEGTQNNGINPSPDANTVNSLGQDVEVLRSIDQTLKSILSQTPNMSQANAHNQMPGRQFGSPQRDSRTAGAFGRNRQNTFDSRSLEDGFREAIMEGLLGSDFRDGIRNSLGEFADQLGVNINDIPNEIGKRVGQDLMNAFKNSPIGQNITNRIQGYANNALSGITDRFRAAQGGQGATPSPSAPSVSSSDAASNVASQVASEAGQQALTEAATNVAGQAATNVTAEAGAGLVGQVVSGTAGTAGVAAGTAGTAGVAGGSMASLASGAATAGPALAALGPAIGPVLVAFAALTLATHLFGPAIEGITDLFKGMSKAANRYEESRKKNLEEAKKRMAADYETVIREPFEILKSAAEEVYQVWDQQLRTITATQGYNKADLQNLMGVYAQRLRDEGLASVVSGADVTSNLAKVLESGLSGAVAEEFAFLATTLNAAIPTQDFFNYAETYASLAANAIKNGYSQSEAISYANSQLEQFASNVLYASRELSGGFSSGLKDAQSLFDSSVQIAAASKTGIASQISGVLTSVSAIVGAIAPDLASGIVDSVVKAATGGNSSEIVALRSLAGINASNTEFLQALAANPQGVFSALFSNLANMQNMSNDNFMEVAEGLSDVFGISMDAFARVDFNYLADAISQMNVNNASLSENLSLLASGETTTTAEQLKAKQVNEYMIEEGLAYVLDNEAARAIQQHMWDEQIARELQESTYSVELQGSALDFLEGIRKTVQNVLDFLNPLSFLKKIGNLFATKAEATAQKADLTQMLELGKVGQSNAKLLRNLTTTNKDLNLATPLVELMGGKSAYASAKAFTKAWNTAWNPAEAISGGGIAGLIQEAVAAATSSGSPVSTISSNSRYNWTTAVGKSVANALSSSSNAATSLLGSPVQQAAAANTESAASAKSNGRFQEFLDSMQKYVEDNKTFDEWKDSASKFGIKDYKQALEDSGQSEEDLKSAFQAQEAKQASEHKANREKQEDKFWELGIAFWKDQHPLWAAAMLQHVTNTNEYLTEVQIEELSKQTDYLYDISNSFSKFYKEWISYFIEHNAYSKATLKAYDVAAIKTAEKDEYGNSINALAQALTSNAVDLKDPAVQTNALLAKILLVAEQLLQVNSAQSGGSTSSIATTLAALGLGITT